MVSTLFLSLLHPHKRSTHTKEAQSVGIAFACSFCLSLWCSLSFCLCHRAQLAKGHQLASRGRGGWELSTGRPVLKEPKTHTRQPPQPQNTHGRSYVGWQRNPASTVWGLGSCFGAPHQKVVCKLSAGSSSSGQRSENFLHFSVSPEFWNLVFSPKMGDILLLLFGLTGLP